MKKLITIKKFSILSIIALSVLITVSAQAGFDPIPKKTNRHIVSNPDFGKKQLPEPIENPAESGEQPKEPDIAADIAREITQPINAVDKLVNKPDYLAKTLDYEFDVSKIGSWQTAELNEKQVRIAPVLIADSGWEMNLNQVTATFEGDGKVYAAMVYYYNDNFDKAVEAKSYTSFRELKSGQTTTFSNGNGSQGCGWIVLSAEGKIKLTGLKQSCNTVKNAIYGHIPREYRFANGSLQYRILYPHNYDPNKKYPLVIGCHGSGGVGNDNRKSMEKTNLGRFLYISYYNDPKFECFSIIPQIPDNNSIPAPYYPNGNVGLYNKIFHPVPSLSAVNATGWYTQATLALVQNMLESTELSIDPDRIYFAGFSYGGKACWEFLKAEPDLFAGVACCAGWPIGAPYNAPSPMQLDQLRKEIAGYKNIPVFITAGEKDAMNIPSKVVDEEIRKQGGHSTYKEYPGADHVGSAIRTWSDSEVVNWLFDQKKQPEAPQQ